MVSCGNMYNATLVLESTVTMSESYASFGLRRRSPFSSCVANTMYLPGATLSRLNWPPESARVK